MTDETESPSLAAMPFTGERFTPECVREIWYEHWHRYAFCRSLVKGRRILDAACGEGYGSAMLAAYGAKSVLGIDVDAEAIEHARSRYAERSNLSFQLASVADLPLQDAAVDLVVSFETIEHLLEQEQMLDEFERVLSPGGALVISSPDRHKYNQLATEPNPYHLRELSMDELDQLLAKKFAVRRYFGQKLCFKSMIFAREPHETSSSVENLRMKSSSELQEHDHETEPTYHLVVCVRSENDLPGLPGLSLFSDDDDSVYAHYNQEVRRVVACDLRIHQLERELAELRSRLAPQGPR